MFILPGDFYIICLNNYMFRPLYQVVHFLIIRQSIQYTTVILLNGNFTIVHKSSLTKTKHCILYTLPYNKKVFNLMIAYIKVETYIC